MANFMTDHAANSTVIYRWICVNIEKRWLQNSGWENNLITVRAVIGVYGLRQHKPFGLIDRLTQLGNHIVVTPFT